MGHADRKTRDDAGELQLMTREKLAQLDDALAEAQALKKDVEQKRASAAARVAEVAAARGALPPDENAIRQYLLDKDEADLKLEIAERMLTQAQTAIDTTEAALKRAKLQHQQDRLKLRIDFVMKKAKSSQHHFAAVAQILAEFQLVNDEWNSLIQALYMANTHGGFVGEKIILEVSNPLSAAGWESFSKAHLPGVDGIQLWPLSKSAFAEIQFDLPDL